MKESKRRQSLSGAVLIMILTVMFVLIILLTATLTTVTTANQRIYTKFEENQAYYTARSALDVFTQNMLSDANYVSGIDYTYTKAGSNATVPMKQGLGLQMDLYMLKSQNGFCNVPQDKLKNFVTSTSDTDLQKVEYEDWFGTDSSKVKNNGKPTTDPDYKEYVEYEVELPQLANGGSQYGKLSDLEGSGSNKVPKAKIKVEVLDRTYDIGNYDSTPYDKTTKEGINAFFENASDSAKAEAVVSGVRKNDVMSIKITATTTFDGVEGIAVLILDSNKPPVNNSSRAVTAFGNLNLTNHAFIVGGVSVVGDGTNNLIAWRNGGGEFGTVYSETGLQFNVVSSIYMTDGEYMYVGGDLICDNSSDIKASVTNPSDMNKRPYVFVNGDVTVGNSGLEMGGTGNEAIDLIIKGDLNIPGNKFKFNGNIYCNGNCTISSTGLNVGDAVVNGDLYVGGNLNVSGNMWQANDDGTGKIRFQQGTGSIYVDNSSIITGGDGASYSAAMLQNENGTALGTFGKSSFTFPDKANDVQNVTSTGESTFAIKLPNGIEKTLDTHKGNYDTYYVMDESGYVDVDSDGNVPDRKSAEDFAEEDFTAASFIPTDTLKSAGTSIDVPPGSTVKYLLASDSYNNQKYEIKGGGTVELVLGIAYNPYWMPSDCTIQNIEIVADDDTTVKVYGGIKNGEYKLEGFKLWTKTAYDAYYSNTDLNVGSQHTSGHDIKVPKIYYYFSGGKVITTNGPCFLTGYFFGPDATLEANAGNNVKFNNLYYNGMHVDPNWIYDFLGSVLCDNFSLQNEHGIIYINPALEDDTPGEPIHQWKSSMYVRS